MPLRALQMSDIINHFFSYVVHHFICLPVNDVFSSYTDLEDDGANKTMDIVVGRITEESKQEYRIFVREFLLQLSSTFAHHKTQTTNTFVQQKMGKACEILHGIRQNEEPFVYTSLSEKQYPPSSSQPSHPQVCHSLILHCSIVQLSTGPYRLNSRLIFLS